MLFFDVGIVNEDKGRNTNRGWMQWEESFGAKPYVHQLYRLEIGRVV